MCRPGANLKQYKVGNLLPTYFFSNSEECERFVVARKGMLKYIDAFEVGIDTIFFKSKYTH